MRRLFTFLATLAYVGRIPWAPGTWGSLVGLCLGAGLSSGRPGSLQVWLWLMLGFVLSCIVCSSAEQSTGRVDPPEIVLDEGWAMLLIVLVCGLDFQKPALLALAFTFFRIFDITKPPPLKRLARYPGGLGIMADDFGAALYTLALLWPLQRWLGV